jgi:hypothetical protein
MVNDFVLRKYRRILADLDKSKYNVILLLNTEEEDHWDVPDDVTCFTTNSEILNALCYIRS